MVGSSGLAPHLLTCSLRLELDLSFLPPLQVPLWRRSLPPCTPPSCPCIAVTASQVAGSHGALALYLLPRYLLINTLDVPVQYKQQVGGVLPARACCLPFGALAELLLAAVSLDSLTAGAFLLRKALSCPHTRLRCLPSFPSSVFSTLQGTQQERELLAGASCALRWSDVLRPLRLCVRMQEAGWLWSGGFELDSPGDLFIKIR